MVIEHAPATLQEAIVRYADLDYCQATLVAARWPDGVICPTCGSRQVGYLANQRRWQCAEKHARRQFSVKVGTIFEDSPISLSKWFTAIWLIQSAKNGISSYEVSRAIGITQKSAWFVMHRIRLAMQTQSFNKIGGEVEVDETYIGGKARFMHKDKKARLMKGRTAGNFGKVAVQGLLERHGKDGHSTVRTMVVRNNRREPLMQNVTANVEPGSSVYTDSLGSYRDVRDNFIHDGSANVGR